MTLYRTVLISFVVLAATAAHAAKPIATPPIHGGLPGLAGTRCVVVNLGAKDAEVTVEIVDAISGTTLVSVGPNTVAPSVRTGASDATATTAFCRVSGLSKKSAGVTFFGIDASGNSLLSVTFP